MYIIVRMLWPSHKGAEVGKKYEEVMQKYPPDPNLAKVIVPGAFIARTSGIQSLYIVEVKEGKYTEAVIRIGKAMSMYAEIEGLEYSIVTWATLAETMKMSE